MSTEISFYNNIIVGGGIEKPEDFLKQQEILKTIDKEYLTDGVKSFKQDFDNLIKTYSRKYNCIVRMDSYNKDAEVKFEISLDQY